MRVAGLVFPVLLMFLLASSISVMAFNWWQSAEGAGAGAVVGAVVGSVFPGLGTLAGAGVGALAGFLGASVPQLFVRAPVTTTSFSAWYDYAKDSAQSIYEESELIADQEVDQVNLLQTASMPFTVTAQKWEQVNYNANNPPSSPQMFYQLLSQTGFLDYARKLVGGTQSLWVAEQGMINALNQQLKNYGLSISYNVDPNTTVTIQPNVPATYFVVVYGQVTVYPNGYIVNVTTLAGTPPAIANPFNLTDGAYVISFSFPQSAILASPFIDVSPEQGAVLLFRYNPSADSFTPIQWGFDRPTSLYLEVNGGINTTYTLPATQASLPYTAEQVAINMLASAEAEYTVLKNLGYQSSSQIPPNMTLPTIELNIGNFSNFNTSLQAYNIYLAEYTRQLLQLQQTLQTLAQEGRLNGLEQLSTEVANPLTLYGKYGGFIVNGTISLPNGLDYNGLFLIQPYGGSLSLSSNGGMVGSGGAIAYQLIPVGNGTYGLGTMYLLQPGTVIQGNVANPGTLQSTPPLHVAYYYNASAPQPPPTDSGNGLLNSLVNYFKAHPLVFVVTALFVLIVLVAVIRSL
jgi:hypothetical protein